MSITQIEAKLAGLSAAELRRLALNSWAAYVQKEHGDATVNDCEENDPRLLAALDEAVSRAGQPATRVFSCDEVRTRINQWSAFHESKQ